jgi:hypothetical protein
MWVCVHVCVCVLYVCEPEQRRREQGRGGFRVQGLQFRVQGLGFRQIPEQQRREQGRGEADWLESLPSLSFAQMSKVT